MKYVLVFYGGGMPESAAAQARVLKQWDTRKPFPGFDPKLGSKTLDIYSED